MSEGWHWLGPRWKTLPPTGGPRSRSARSYCAAKGRRRQPGDAGRSHRGARHAGREPAEGVLLHRSLQGLSDGADPPVEGKTRHHRAAAAPPMQTLASKAGRRDVRREIVAVATATTAPPPK